MGWTRVIYDDFNRADEGPIASPWTPEDAFMQLKDTKLYRSLAGSGGVIHNYAGLLPGKQAAAIKCSEVGTANYVIVRNGASFAALQGYKFVRIGTTVSLYAVTGGSQAEIAFGAGNPTGTMGIIVDGTNIKCYGAEMGGPEDLTAIPPDQWATAPNISLLLEATDATYSDGSPNCTGVTAMGYGATTFAGWAFTSGTPDGLMSNFGFF
jgi:hypothetical protein